MYNKFSIVLIAIIVMGFTACNSGSKVSTSEAANQADSVAIALGYSIGTNLSQQFSDLDPESMSDAFITTFKGDSNEIFANTMEADMYIRGYLREQQENAQDTTASETQTASAGMIDSVSVGIGFSLGTNIEQSFPDVNPELISAAMTEGFKGEENLLFASPQEADMTIRTYLQAEEARAFEENKVKGEEFLAENANKDGVQVTESGLQYEVIVEGYGEMPTAENTVSVTYHGTTIDGEVFDSSIERGDTVSFPLGGVIAGWTEGLQLMKVGSKYKFYIPSDLGYGERGAGGAIGPNSTLIFEVELIGIEE